MTVPHSPLQALTVFQRSLTTMQIQIQGLIQYALPLFPTAEVLERRAGDPHPSFCSPELPDPSLSPQKDLLGVQHLLNSSETSLHQLTALLDCRGLHKVRWGLTGDQPWHPPAVPPALPVSLQDYLDGLIGICYDGVEGLLYLGLFSLLAAAAFSTVICAAPRAWRQLAARWVCPETPAPAHMASLWSPLGHSASSLSPQGP